MAAQTGRSISRYVRAWGGTAAVAYDLSGDATSVGTLGIEFESQDIKVLNSEVVGAMLGRPTFSLGPINSILTTGAAGVGTFDKQAILQGTLQTMLIAWGMREAPTYGSIAFMGQFHLKSLMGLDTDVTHSLSASYSPTTPAGLNYVNAWGRVTHPLAAETAANTGTTNVVDGGAATTAGGYLVYVLTSINAGTVAISIDDSADGTSYSALSGATSGALSAVGAGLVQLGTTATVRRYTRWQIALAGGASAVTFAIGFVRG